MYQYKRFDPATFIMHITHAHDREQPDSVHAYVPQLQPCNLLGLLKLDNSNKKRGSEKQKLLKQKKNEVDASTSFEHILLGQPAFSG